MNKKLRMFVSGLLISGLIIGAGLQQSVEAATPRTNELVSYNAANTAISSNSDDQSSHISDDGKIVAWTSNGNDIISGVTPGYVVYTRDLASGVASVASKGVSGPVIISTDAFAMSQTGRYVAFSSKDTSTVTSPTVTGTNRSHLYLRDMLLNTTTLVDQTITGVPANLADGGSSIAKSVSDDGRFVTFSSTATNLLASGNPTSTSTNFYVKDMLTGAVINPLVSNSGARANTASTGNALSSCDGSLVLIGSNATNLTPQDNGNFNTYLVDLRTGYNIKNLTYGANQGTNPISISCNGRYVTMYSNATNLTADVVSGTVQHIFLYDRLTDTYSLVDQSTSGSVSTVNNYPYGSRRVVSDNGRVVFFSSDKNLVSPTATYSQEVYVRDTQLGTTELVPNDSSGVEIGLGTTTSVVTRSLSISLDGNRVVYASLAANLIPGVGSALGKKVVLTKLN